MKRIVLGLMVMVLATGTATRVLAAGDQMGFTTYYFSDDKENTVLTTSFNLAKKIIQQTALLIDIELDNVTVPPVSATTGATRPQRRKEEPFEKSRGQIIVGIEQGLGANTSFAGNFYRSQEVDYLSTSAIGTLTQEFFQKNLTITIRGQYNWDQVGEILDDATLVNRRKTVLTGALVATQLLSPTTVLDLHYDFVDMKGFLSDPYRRVTLSGADSASTREVHPDYRVRHAGTARLSQMIPSIQAGLIASYRYYFDTWKVRSSTIELRLNKSIVDEFILGVDFRYYTQTGASFYAKTYVGNSYLGADAFRTADYKLKPFNSNNFGLSLTYLFKGLAKVNPDLEFLQNSSFEIMYFRYFNTLDFSANIFQGSLRFSI